MRIIVICVIAALLAWRGWLFIQSPETLLKKKTQKLISMASIKSGASDLALMSHVSQISKFIHFDVRVKAEYQGQTLTAKSLNEFRSLLFQYFKQGGVQQLSHKGLTVKLEKSKDQALAQFDAVFEKQTENIACKFFLEWIKGEKWHVKKIEALACATAS